MCSVTVAGSCQSLVECHTCSSSSPCEKTRRRRSGEEQRQVELTGGQVHDLAAQLDLACARVDRGSPNTSTRSGSVALRRRDRAHPGRELCGEKGFIT